MRSASDFWLAWCLVCAKENIYSPKNFRLAFEKQNVNQTAHICEYVRLRYSAVSVLYFWKLSMEMFKFIREIVYEIFLAFDILWSLTELLSSH